MGRFKYTESEKETLKVLKMQQQQLDILESKLGDKQKAKGRQQKEELDELKKRVEFLLEQQGGGTYSKTTRYI